MSKQRKPPGQEHGHETRDATVAAPDLDPSLVEQGILGNAALQERLAGDAQAEGLAAAGGQQVAAQAAALAGQARVALTLRPRPDDRQERLVDIVARSGLPAARREALIERLETQQVTAHDAHAVVEQVLGPLSEAARSAWTEALGRVLADIAAGRLPPGGVEPAAWVGALVAEAAPGLDGEAASALCRAVLWQLHFDEEEEEEEAHDYATESSGL